MRNFILRFPRNIRKKGYGDFAFHIYIYIYNNVPYRQMVLRARRRAVHGVVQRQRVRGATEVKGAPARPPPVQRGLHLPHQGRGRPALHGAR